MIWSMAWRAKFIVINYITGLSPTKDDPIPMPVNPASVMGVSTTRDPPYLANKPFDILYAPLYSATYSPIK